MDFWLGNLAAPAGSRRLGAPTWLQGGPRPTSCSCQGLQLGRCQEQPPSHAWLSGSFPRAPFLEVTKKPGGKCFHRGNAWPPLSPEAWLQVSGGQPPPRHAAAPSQADRRPLPPPGLHRPHPDRPPAEVPLLPPKWVINVRF